MEDEDKEFTRHADESLTVLYRLLAAAADDYNFDVQHKAETLMVEFESPPAKFVISPHKRARQIWISANRRSYKLIWDIVEAAFVLAGTGETLNQLVEQAISERLGEDFSL